MDRSARIFAFLVTLGQIHSLQHTFERSFRSRRSQKNGKRSHLLVRVPQMASVTDTIVHDNILSVYQSK